MTALTYFRQCFGAGEFALAVEGVPDYWTTTLAAWNWPAVPPSDMPDPSDWIQRAGRLDRKSLRASQVVDPASGELRQGDITFEILDGEDADGNTYSVSALMSRRAAAVQAHLAADLAAGAATMTLDSTAGFVAPGVVHIELEAKSFTGIAAGPPRLTGLTGGLYGSVDRAHEYEAPNAVISTADYGQIPLVTDRLVSWYGRRCWLFFAEYLEDGTLDEAEIIWRGRVTSELRATSKVSWSIPAEGIWSAQGVELLGTQPQSVVQGFYLRGDVSIGFDLVTGAGVLADDSLFLIPAGRYRSPEELCAVMTEALNTELDALAASDDRWALFVEEGLLRCQKSVQDAINPLWCDLYFTDGGGEDIPIVAGFLGMDAGTRMGAEQWRLEDGQDGIRLVSGPRAATIGRAAAAVFYAGTEGRWVPVEDGAVFTPFLDESVVNDWRVQSVLTLDGDPYIFDDINAGSHIVHVVPFTDRQTEQLRRVVVQYIGDAPIQVKQGVWFRGQMPLVWRDAFLDNTNVPERMKLGADSRDFDWTDLDAQFSGGVMDRRDRLLTGPVAFKDLLVEDFRFSGMAPVIGLDGRITARPINSSSLVRADGAALFEVDETVVSGKARPETVRSAKRVVNRLEIHVVREYGRPGGNRVGDQRIDLTVLVNDKTSQAAYRCVRGVSVEFSGTATVDPVELAGHAYGVAASLFALLSQDSDTIRFGPLNGSAYGTLPLDTVLVSHWMPPDPTSPGDRGLASLPAVVLGLEVDYNRGEIWLDLELVTDSGQRSGFAPAADINSYTDHGAPAGARRYEISLNTGRYCDAAVVEEGSFFHVGDKVVIRQWDVDAITVADEAFSVTAVDPDALFLGGAPSAGMQAEIAAGRANVTFNLYDTAGQSALAKLYLHVADDADNLLGTSGVLGFRVS